MSEPCIFCGKKTDNLNANPMRWALWFPDPDVTGVTKPHCTGCVIDKLDQLAARDRENERLRAALTEIRETTREFGAMRIADTALDHKEEPTT